MVHSYSILNKIKILCSTYIYQITYSEKIAIHHRYLLFWEEFEEAGVATALVGETTFPAVVRTP